MSRSPFRPIHNPQTSSSPGLPNRRHFLFGAGAAAFAATHPNLLAEAFALQSDHTSGPLKIEAVELIELHGRYTDVAGVNRQQQVNPLDIYDDLRPTPYADKPSGTREVLYTAIYLRIRTGGIEGLRDASALHSAVARPFATFAGQDLYPDDFEKQPRYFTP